MYQIKTDLHVHSIFTNHAYSTIEENARYAASIGMECIAITDHFGPLFINNVEEAIFNFCNRVVLPPNIHGIRVLRGIEIDIIDYKGNLAYQDITIPFFNHMSVTEKILGDCEFVIASVHESPTFQPSTISENTEMYINALCNPFVHMIGHSGRAGMPFDIDEVLKVAKEEGKIIEINNHSFQLGRCEPCQKIAERCAELGVFISVDSDAHFSHAIGRYDNAIQMLEQIHFPEELIVNTSKDRLLQFLQQE